MSVLSQMVQQREQWASGASQGTFLRKTTEYVLILAIGLVAYVYQDQIRRVVELLLNP